MPGANARAMEKSRSLAADALIFDLEDAVAPDAKLDCPHAGHPSGRDRWVWETRNLHSHQWPEYALGLR